MLYSLSWRVTPEMKYYAGKPRTISRRTIDQPERYVRETDFCIDSHTGTHVDYPAHKVKGGKFGDVYPVDYLCSDKVAVVYLDLTDKEHPVAKSEHLKNANIPADSEIVLLRTGFSQLRNENRYWAASPVISPDIPLYLKTNLPTVKALGFDAVSATSQLDKPAGNACHENCLSDKDGREILIIEDMDLSPLNENSKIKRFTALSWLYQNMDGGLLAVTAEITEQT